MKTTGYTWSSGRLHHSVISSTTLSVIREIVSFDTVAGVHVGEVRGHLTGGQPARGEREHALIDTRQPPLPLLDRLRLEATVPVAWDLDLWTGPISVVTVFDRVPLREFPLWCPAGSWGS